MVLTEKKNKIPLDKKNLKVFTIEIDCNLYSINILFDWKEKIELDNLFLILKSYVLSKEILIKGIYVIGSSQNLSKNNIKPNFFRSINLNKLEKIGFFDFTLLYDEMLESDTQLYLNNYDYYGFTIVLMKESKIWIDKKFYPIYPWLNNFKNIYILRYKNIKELNKLKKENFILKKKLKYSVYRDGYKIWRFTKRDNSNRERSI